MLKRVIKFKPPPIWLLVELTIYIYLRKMRRQKANNKLLVIYTKHRKTIIVISWLKDPQ